VAQADNRKPVDGIWVLGGYGLAPMSIIDTEEGLIAFDTGDTKHDGEIKAIRTVSKKPIKAIMYGHSHTCFGAGVLAEGPSWFSARDNALQALPSPSAAS
jgi:alkyl sulfatase BDS1-like metallo-beta-lactamase superfamily hydrolase